MEKISANEAGKRLDVILTERYPHFSRTYFQKLIHEGLVLLNGQQVKKRIKPEEGDEIEVEFALTPETNLQPEEIPLDILLEDDHILVVNKPAGLVVHPGAGNWTGTFANALLFHCEELPGKGLRPGIVHRLDKETSGALVAAKTEEAHRELTRQFADREVHKEYVAICVGSPGNVTICSPLARHPRDRRKFTIDEGGKAAITHVKVEGFDQKLSVVRIQLETGRTHQIRVHLQHHRTPILGDKTYGSSSQNQKYGVERQLLHAHILEFKHPTKGEMVRVEAPLPEDISGFVAKIC